MRMREPYGKLVTQLFGDRMMSPAGCSTVVGLQALPPYPMTTNRTQEGQGPAWASPCSKIARVRLHAWQQVRENVAVAAGKVLEGEYPAVLSCRQGMADMQLERTAPANGPRNLKSAGLEGWTKAPISSAEQDV